ncbi:hypothetical protein BDZ45DRAFT_785035 [Acephala macrosclerotiorum]|nr:hypothetical protein BDZ45DRAFT_785035 [Acephala macrosclerotiorum]
MFFLRHFMKVFNILMALVATYLGVYCAFNYATGLMTPALTTFCCIPGSSFFEFCHAQVPKPSVKASPSPEFNYTERLEQLQLISAESVDLPYHLQASEGSIGDMIVRLSAVDLPSRQKLMPLLNEYRDLVDATIDGLQDFLANIDQVVDDTIHINSWASYKLGRIEKRDASVLHVVTRSVYSLFSFRDIHINKAGVRRVFLDMTASTQKQLEGVLREARFQRATLRKLKNVLDNIAITVLGDKAKLDEGKMQHASYWKWIFESHRAKLADFDTKMELCASFYSQMKQALNVVSGTQFKLQKMQGELSQMRQNLQDAPVVLIEESAPLQLYIHMLNSGVQRLEATRTATKMLKNEKIKTAKPFLKY